MANRYLCPVCGYELDFAPWLNDIASLEICPCCGLQFGYDDMVGGNLALRQALYAQKRALWIKNGKIWWSTSPPPENWDPDRQLDSLKK
jgi:hypothetical protein